jgi:hypothetical protein
MTTEGASANDSTRAVRDTVRGSENQPTAIKELFRRAIKMITGRDADKPEPDSKKGHGDAEGAFHPAANAVVTRARRLSEEAYAAAIGFLSDALEWMHICGDDALSHDTFDAGQETASNHLHPHP